MVQRGSTYSSSCDDHRRRLSSVTMPRRRTTTTTKTTPMTTTVMWLFMILECCVILTSHVVMSTESDSRDVQVQQVREPKYCRLGMVNVDNFVHDLDTNTVRKYLHTTDDESHDDKNIFGFTDDELSSSVGNIEMIRVRKCYCAEIYLNEPNHYCPEEHDMCKIETDGLVLCYKEDSEVSAARGVWPFCLFWYVTLLYLWLASEPGRRARGYVHRHFKNFSVKWQTHDGQPRDDDGNNNNNDDNNNSGNGGNGVTSTSSSQVENGVTGLEDGLASPSTPADQAPRESHPAEGSSQLRNNTGGQGQQVANDIENPSTEQLSGTEQQQQGNRSSSSSSPSESATNANANGIETHDFPPEFGSYTNYKELLRELFYINRYELDRLARLWYSAYERERRQQNRLLRRERRNRRRNNNNDNDDVDEGNNNNTNGDGAGTNINGNNNTNGSSIFRPNTQTQSFIAAWWSPPRQEQQVRRIHLELKTKRYDADAQQEEKAERDDDDGTNNDIGKVNDDDDGNDNDGTDDEDDDDDNASTRFDTTVTVATTVTSASSQQQQYQQEGGTTTATSTTTMRTGDGQVDISHVNEKDDDDDDVTDHDKDGGQDDDNVNMIFDDNRKKTEYVDINHNNVEEDLDNDMWSLDSSFDSTKKKCAICLLEIEHDDIVGNIPCNHLFHKECLKSWLQRSNRCPLCSYEGIAKVLSEEITRRPITSTTTTTSNNN